jgi:hypothetical protein
VIKPWEEIPYRLALVFPDIYDLGMSNLGLMILYDIVIGNRTCWPSVPIPPGWTCWQLCAGQAFPFTPWRAGGRLRAFDVIGFSLPYEQLYTNVLTTLDLAGIPLRAAERGDEVPLILAGVQPALTLNLCMPSSMPSSWVKGRRRSWRSCGRGPMRGVRAQPGSKLYGS